MTDAEAWAKAWDNRGLAVLAAKRLAWRAEVEFDDLMQEGLFALKRAAELYDPSRGARWSTYAYIAAWNQMVKWIHVENGVIRVPLQASRDRATDLDELDPSRRKRAEAGRLAMAMCALDDLTPETWLEAPAEEDRCDHQDSLRIVDDAMESLLDDRERSVLHHRFAESKTLREAGRAIGLSKEMVRKIQKEALSKLRRAIA